MSEIVKNLDRDLQQRSWVAENLYFEITRTIECTECQEKTQAFEILLALPLPLFGLSQPYTLQKCIDNFFLTEKIMQTCKKCKKKTKTSFKKEISHLPSICIFHLQRMTPFQTKIDDIVEFPSENLDFSKYIISNMEKDKALFDIYAICNHYGASNQSGHYTTYSKNFLNQRWFCYNDSTVSPLQSSLINKNNYILFYEKKNL